MTQEIFKFKKVNLTKLKEYGFKKVGDKYQFATPIFNKQFTMFVFVNASGEVSTKVVDNEFNEEYILHLVESSVGDFVGHVKADYERVLTDISECCFDKEIFKSEQAKQIISYVNSAYGDELEFLWEKFPQDAIWRRKDNKKWYALIVDIEKEKLGLEGKEVIEIINIKCYPEMIGSLRKENGVLPAYHMNKEHWVTLLLDGSLIEEKVLQLLDLSFELTI